MHKYLQTKEQKGIAEYDCNSGETEAKKTEFLKMLCKYGFVNATEFYNYLSMIHEEKLKYSIHVRNGNRCASKNE